MIEKLLKATDRMQSVMSVASLRSYISTGSAEQMLAFYIESWQAGRGWLSSAFEHEYYIIGSYPDSIRLPLVGIATVWSEGFKNNPKSACEGLLYVETQFWKKGDRVGDAWVLWLRDMLKQSLGKDVDDLMRQYLNQA
jgi:hypothetical protein